MSHLLPISHSPHARACARSGVVVAGGAAAETRRRWPEGVVAVGAAERERESARERERARESAREIDSGIAEALARGGRRVREFRTLNKPYGFGC